MKKNMPKSKNGPRSNFSFLPFALRYKVIGMIQDGATCANVAADPEVRAAYARMGAEFNRAAMTKIKKSAEYRDLSAKRSKLRDAEYNDALSRAALDENGTLENIAEQTKVALLKVVNECISGAEDPKEVERLVRSAVTLANTAKDSRIADLSRKLDDAKRLHEASETEWKTREAELLAQVKQLTAENAELAASLPGVDASDVADALKKKFGVM